MAKKRKKTSNEDMKMIIMVSIVIFMVVFVGIYYLTSGNNNQTGDNTGEVGTGEVIDTTKTGEYQEYTDNTIRKKLTVNDQDDFERDVLNNKTSDYHEFIYDKSVGSFIEMDYSYSNDLKVLFDITYDLGSKSTSYTYNVSSKGASVLLVGTYNEKAKTYTCRVDSVVNYKLNNKDSICQTIKTRLKNFIKEKNKAI